MRNLWSAAGQRLEQAFETKLCSILFVLTGSFLLGLPMLHYGPLVDGHDTHEHLNFTRHFSEQFWRGELYPRWLIDINHGLGSPSYFVFPPLPAYLVAILQPVARVFHANAFVIAAFLPLLASGVCAFLWLHTMVNRQNAAIGAVLYMAMPYHLAIDFYRRCAIPECWAFAWMPLILYFTAHVIAGKPRAVAGLAVAYALMIFSHLVTLAMFFPVPFVLAVIQSPPGKKLRSVLHVGIATALGAGVSSVYLLSALANAKYIPASRLVTRDFYQVANQLLNLGKGLFVHSNDSWFRFLQEMSWTVVSMILFAAVCSIVALKFARPSSRKTILLWIAVCGFAVLMMSRLSSPLWNHFDRLHEAIQFPWRFNALLCLGSVALLATALSNLPRDWGFARTISLSAIAVIVATWMIPYGNVLWHYRVDLPPSPPNERHLISDNDGWLPAWLPAGTDQRSSLLASQGPRVRFKEASGTAQVLVWKPRQIEIQTDSAGGGWVMINQFYYPSWRAELPGQTIPLETRTALPEGLLEVKVPAGVQEIQVRIPVSRLEQIGRWLSALCTLLCIMLALHRDYKVPQSQADYQHLPAPTVMP